MAKNAILWCLSLSIFNRKVGILIIVISVIQVAKWILYSLLIFFFKKMILQIFFIMHLHVLFLLLLHTKASSMSCHLMMCFVMKYLSGFNSPSFDIVQLPVFSYEKVQITWSIFVLPCSIKKILLPTNLFRIPRALIQNGLQFIF